MSDSNKRLKVFIPLFFSAVLILGMFLGFKLRDKEGYRTSHFSIASQNSLFHQIFRLIHLKYVDSIQIQDLKSNAVNGILSHLDPHSAYIPPEELAKVNEEMQGSFHGIGIAYFMIHDTINVTRVLPDGPAEKAGIEIGDQIIKAADSLVAGVHITSATVQKLLRGPVRSEVQLEILRNGRLRQLTLKRDVIPLKSIDAAYMIKPGVAYLRINRFSAHTYGEFMDAITGLKKKNTIKKFILDLRSNPGGFMDAAVNIADEFLSGSKMVVYTQGKSYPRKEFTCNKTGELEDVPLAVLVNGRSASASEILAGAIQDWDRGYIIGRQTYGKGLVQEQYHLVNGAALRLTVARYYLPSGRLIQRPYKHRLGAYSHDLAERFKHGEMLHADSIHFKDTTSYFTKTEHRPVHAGGGIMPDVFVPMDTAKLSPVLMELHNNHILFRFAYQYRNRHSSVFSKFKNASDLIQADIFPDSLPEALKQMADKAHVSGMEQLTTTEIRMIYLQIKAFIARELWQDEGYYEVLNQQDKGIREALDVLQRAPDLKKIKRR